MVASIFFGILLFDTFHLLHSRYVEQKMHVAVIGCSQVKLSSFPPLLRLVDFVRSRKMEATLSTSSSIRFNVLKTFRVSKPVEPAVKPKATTSSVDSSAGN